MDTGNRGNWPLSDNGSKLVDQPAFPTSNPLFRALLLLSRPTSQYETEKSICDAVVSTLAVDSRPPFVPLLDGVIN